MNQARAHQAGYARLAYTRYHDINLGSLRHMEAFRELNLPVLNNALKSCHIHTRIKPANRVWSDINLSGCPGQLLFEVFGGKGALGGN